MKKTSTRGTLDFPTQSRELSAQELAEVTGGTPSIPIPPPQATPSIPIPPPLP